jgi:hypothetical protein
VEEHSRSRAELAPRRGVRSAPPWDRSACGGPLGVCHDQDGSCPFQMLLSCKTSHIEFGSVMEPSRLVSFFVFLNRPYNFINSPKLLEIISARPARHPTTRGLRGLRSQFSALVPTIVVLHLLSSSRGRLLQYLNQAADQLVSPP